MIEEPFDRAEHRAGSGGRAHEAPRHVEPPQGETEESPEPPDRVDVLGPGKHDARSLTRDHAQGIEVAARVTGDTLVYQLKVPLATTASQPYAIGASAGQTIGIGFETPKVSPPRPEASGGFGGRGYGRGGYGGGHRGAEPEEHRGFQETNPLNAWGVLTLR